MGGRNEMNHPVPDSIDDLMKDVEPEWIEDFDTLDLKCRVYIRMIAIPEKAPSELLPSGYRVGVRCPRSMAHMFSFPKAESDLKEAIRKRLSERPMIQSKSVPDEYLPPEFCKLQNERYERLSIGTTENGDYRIPILGYMRRGKLPDDVVDFRMTPLGIVP